uniref:Mesothelin n=1 Tax=Aotus nancymaae TaxID=37293 RepID=A0A2K5D1E2_AOTNA
MALPTAGPPLGSCGSPALGSLLFLLLSLGWVQLSKSWAGETGQVRSPLGTQGRLFRSRGGALLCSVCHAHGNTLSPAPSLHSPAAFSGSQACTRFFSRVSKANVDLLPRGAPERQRLLPAALAWWWGEASGVRGSLVSEADVRALGGLACDLPGRFVAESAEVVLPRLVHCLGPLDQEQQEAARAALQDGGPPYGPPSTWSVSTLDALQGLLPVLSQPIVRSIPQGIVAAWRKRTSRDPSWWQPEQTILRPRLRRDTESESRAPSRPAAGWAAPQGVGSLHNLRLCPPGLHNLRLCPPGRHSLRRCPLRHNLRPLHPPGLTTSGSAPGLHSLRFCPPGLHNLSLRLCWWWRVPSLPVATLIDRFMMGRSQLDKDTLDILTTFYPGYLCSLSPEQLGSVPPSLIWAIRPQDLDTCGPRQLEVLYPKARLAFQNVNGSEYFSKIRSFLGGAPTEDLKVLSQRNVSMDLATFMKLRTEAVLPLTVAEVQKLLGPHVEGLKAEERHSPVRDWILRQRQDDLDTLGLGLQGGIPNGYLVLDRGVQ